MRELMENETDFNSIVKSMIQLMIDSNADINSISLDDSGFTLSITIENNNE